MGIKVKITGTEEINLTDFTIVRYNRRLDWAEGKNEYMSEEIEGLELFGIMKEYDKSKEAKEVNKLSLWAKKTAHEKDAYCKVEVKLFDNNDVEYDAFEFEKAFFIKYEEGYIVEKGNTEFYAFIREFKDEKMEITPVVRPKKVEPEKLIDMPNDGMEVRADQDKNTQIFTSLSSVGIGTVSNSVVNGKYHLGAIFMTNDFLDFTSKIIMKDNIAYIEIKDKNLNTQAKLTDFIAKEGYKYDSLEKGSGYSNNIYKRDLKAEDYFVITETANLTVRDSPALSGQEVARVPIGASIKVVVPKNTKYDGTRTWVRVYYNGNEIGWVAQELIHPNVPIITTFTNYNTISGKVNGKQKIITPIWGLPGGGKEYGTGEVPKDSQNRYKVAVGPRILYKNYPDTGQIAEHEFSGFSRHIEVELKHKSTGKQKIIKCIVEDLKAHTFSKYDENNKLSVENGIIQTGIRYPNAANGFAISVANMDGSVIEFIGGKFSDFIIDDYDIVKVTANTQRTDLYVDFTEKK